METKEIRYTTEICKTKNILTGNVRYYMVVCGDMVRIAKSRFDNIREGCDGVCNLFDSSTKTHRRNYITVVNYVTTVDH